MTSPTAIAVVLLALAVLMAPADGAKYFFSVSTCVVCEDSPCSECVPKGVASGNKLTAEGGGSARNFGRA
eukprot:m.184609 g.184609  ORF g.184609 m.184609 type:complete len:70 (+) comp10510_c0_seq1:110-319(+)